MQVSQQRVLQVSRMLLFLPFKKILLQTINEDTAYEKEDIQNSVDTKTSGGEKQLAFTVIHHHLTIISKLFEQREKNTKNIIDER